VGRLGEMMKRVLAVTCVSLWSICIAYAVDVFVIKDIQVEGLQRIAAGTVFNYLPVKVGDTLTEESGQQAIRALFKTGFFSDVRLERKDNVLVVTVAERPSIGNIKITGTKDIDEDTLKKSLRDVGLAEGRVFNQSILDKVEQELKRQYFSRGRYAVQVKPIVKPLERNRVAVTIEVSEGRIAKIQQINIVGNSVFDDKQLLKTFTLTPPTLFSFLTKNDQYSKQKLASDLESLRSFYQNQGYLEFSIDSTQVTITPDKQAIYVTVNITEGKKYTIAHYNLAGKLVVSEAELRGLVTIKPGEVFSRQAITDTTKKISDRLGNEGYAFANVNAIPDIDKQKQTVAFTFFIDPGQRVYVRRIEFAGNTTTRDEVLRREMRQFEGGWFSAEKIQRSVARLKRLGFFEEVNVETPPVAGSPDQVDVSITVKERPTGTFLVGIGYSDAEGVLLNSSISYRNLFGTGKELSASINNSEASRNFSINYNNPYYTLDGVSRGFNIYSSKVDAAAANTAAYNSSTAGAGVFFGIPISENRSVNLGFAYENITFDVNSTSAQIAQDFVAQHGDSNDIVKGTVSWAYDTLDSPIFPSQGILQRISGEVALPGSELEYYRMTYLASGYYPVTRNLTFKLKSELGYGDGYGSTTELPFYKNFYAGGTTTVRGYRARSLGPRDPLTLDPVGGASRILLNSEVLFPVPGVKDNKSMRLSVFVDVGMVYAPDASINLDELRYSTGVSFSWFSPIAPLSVSYAWPLNDKPDDRIDRFQFTLGTTFN
jgi:outer membrane protein insertion porin family